MTKLELSEPPVAAMPETGGNGESGAAGDAGDEVFVYPASFAQERLWFLDQLEPGGALYNMPLVLALRGHLAVPELAWALAEIARRHETLRTTFAVARGLPMQVITPAAAAAAPALPWIDLAALPPPRRRRETERRLAAEAARPFDLGRGPLWRATLLRLAASDQLLLVTFHHIVADGWSLAVFGRELGVLYGAAACRHGVPASLPALEPLPQTLPPPLPLQYADYAVWQRQWLAGAAGSEQLAYWRERLAGIPPLAALPLARPRQPVRRRRGAARVQALPAAGRDALYALAQSAGATHFMALLAVFAALLHRFTGERDLVIGTPVAGRTEIETEELIGLFVNLLVLRLELAGNPSFRQLVAAARDVCLGAFDHQELPFEWLVRELQPERSLSHDPVVQVIFGLTGPSQGPAMAAMELPGVRLEPVEVAAGSAKASKFDLGLLLEEAPGGLLARLDFSLDLLDPCDAARLLESLGVLLAGAAARPDCTLDGLPVVPAAALQQVLREWNDTASAYPRESTIAELFEEQARRRPGATALVAGDETLSYGELDARANRLAHTLRGLGVGPEVPVGLALNRSPQAVVAILAILKAGGAYVPLDPAYPAERLAFMLADTAAPVIVSESRHAAALAGAVERGRLVRILELDTVAAALAAQSAAPPPAAIGGGGDSWDGWGGTADNLAYVMYTSGSTGRPKGVAVCQRAVIRLVRGNHFATFGGSGAGESMLQFAPIAFDASTLEIWGSLLNGGRLVIFPDYAPSLRELGQEVARRVTTLWLTAGLFHQLVDEELDSLRGVSQLLAGGDVLMVPHVERVLAALPGLTLINGYGPTENVTFTCCRRLRGAQRLGSSVPIGRPIANTRVYLLDPHLRPVPPGVPGELCTGGDGLARGYFNRPELTAERFVPDPVSGEPGGRLYRTGDLARHLADGDLEFLGRLDQQVKIRGFRVEPGEIEQLLLQHPAVQQAAVVVDEIAPGERRLVAFFVPRPSPGGAGTAAAADTAAKLTAWLRDRLPAAMLPSALEPADALPLDPNGKIDRGALAAIVARLAAVTVPTGARRGTLLAGPEVPPRNPVEELLCEICCDLLHLPGIGVHDSFFDLGGHSLLATQLVSRVREVCGVEVPLRALFEAPTMRAFAARVEAVRQAGEGRTVPLITRVPRDRPLPASFAQERLWFLDQLEGAGSSYNVPLALQLAGRLEPAALAAAWREVVRRHEALRTCFAAAQLQTVQVAQVVTEDLEIGLPTVDLRPLAGLAGGEARRLALAAALRPFDLGRPPLLRALLLRLPATPASPAAPETEASPAAPETPAVSALQPGAPPGEPQHLLVVCLHHIICDGWSLGILLRELAALYGAALAGRPAALPPLAVQYGDFAVWQRAWLSGEVLAEQLAYWRRRLAGAPALLALPTDRPRPAVQTFRGAQRTLALPAPLAGRLRELGRRQGTTLFMTLLAAWAVQLARLTGGEDIPVGSPIANRNRVEIEPLIGFFANTLVLRLDLACDPTCGELLGRVRELTLEAYAHQDLPFEKLVEELRPERALSHSPLFQVMFVLQRQEEAVLELPGVRAEPVRRSGETAKFDLTLGAATEEAGLSLGLELNRDLFDPATAGRLLGGLAALLEQFAGAAAGGRRAAELSLLGAAERHQLLAEWNDTGGGLDADHALHQLVELQARRTPEAVAVVCATGRGDGASGLAGGPGAPGGHGGAGEAFTRLTYDELERLANRLAHRLAALGVGPEVRVGVAIERTAELVVGLLAILKAGGAYVPLDPAYPRERLAFILADAQQGIANPLLLTEEKLRARLPGFRGQVLCLDGQGGLDLEGAGTPEAPSADLPPVGGVPPDSLAYVIYTSGSTGRPKGVAITHRSAVALLRWAGETFSPAELAAVLASTSITFDLSVFELFLPLSRGGTVVIADNALALPTLPASVTVTLINTVPSAMAELLRLGGLPATVTTVNLAGEPLKRALADQIRGELPGVQRLYNLYGPSEDTTYSTFARVAAGAGREPTIGRPISGTRAHVLDWRLQPLPAGVPGELCLGGAGLARCYLERPELTAQSFVPDPFGGPGERLYRTGDLVRRLFDGELDFLGRIDHQVKLRGFRIELGEIETALAAHPRVREAVVVAREDSPGRRRLVAYLTIAGSVPDERGAPHDDGALHDDGTFTLRGSSGGGISGGEISGSAGEQRPSAAALAAFLRERLPDYMVPEAFVLLDALPLTANGKLDRRALPPPEWQRADGAAAFIAPRHPIEELVAGIWSEVLGIEPIGIHDRFFDLGGHSLLATRVVSRVRQACGVEMPLRALFEAPTLGAFAARIEAARQAGEGGSSPPILRVPRDRPLPASFAQERLWFLDQLEGSGSSYNVPLALQLAGQLEPAALAAAWREVVRRHEALRTCFAAAQPHTAQVVQLVAGEIEAGLPLVDLRPLAGLAGGEARRLALAAALRPFDLGRPPLLRALLLRLPAGGTPYPGTGDEPQHLLVVCLHHIICDGWSLGILLRELAALYGAALAGRPAPLPPLAVQYGDFAVWQRAWLTGEVLAEQLAYWRRRLTGAPALLALPTDRPRPAVQGFRGAQRTLALPAPLAGRLRELGRRQGTTLFMTLLAAWGAQLARLTGGEDVPVGSPIANRNRVEIEPLIGFFANTLVLRLDLGGDPTCGELLMRVRELTLEAYAHQDLPFEKLVEELRPERALSHSPLFQVMFLLQRPEEAALELPGIRAGQLQLSGETAKFELTLGAATEQAGLTLGLEFNRDLFDAATAGRMLAGLAALLEQLAGASPRLAADLSLRVAELSLLSAGERHQLLAEWNDTDQVWTAAEPLPAAAELVHELFEWQAARRPQDIAVAGQGVTLRYGELEGRANRLARCLRRLGVGPEVRVGLCVERSPEMVVALLGILKAGGAYVPLDPAHPAERLALVLGDSAVAVLVTEERWLDRLAVAGGALAGRASGGAAAGGSAAGGGAAGRVAGGDPAEGDRSAPCVVCLDRDRERIAAESGAALDRREGRGGGPENLAYLIYTSGSTGRPKGVGLPHRAVVNFLRAMAERPGLGAGDVVPALTTLTFDIAGLEIYLPLAVGGRVEVVERDEAADGRRLAALLAASKATVMQATPATWRLLLDAGWQGPEGGEERPGMPPLRRRGAPCNRIKALCGGEALPRELASALLARGVELWNVYGPTETAVWSAVLAVTAETAPQGLAPAAAVGLGRPIANTRFYVVDRSGEPAPLGVAGELLIGGDGVARGYWRRPELTAERFVPDPAAAAAAGARLYRTGDLVRYRADGGLEFLGRIDHQVKLRGFRIELGEIEAALTAHPRVREAVAMAREDTPGRRRLVAYVTIAGDGSDGGDGGGLPPPGPAALAAFLHERLPDYMVPEACVLLDTLPLTPNGKVDRRALPPPERQRADGAADFVAPRNPIEELVAGVWSEVLGVEPIGIHDRFFDLGGHSLLATQVVSRVRQACGVDLALRALFEAPTLAAFAARVAAGRLADPGQTAPPITRVPRDLPLPASFAQERLWFLDQLGAGGPAYNLAYALRLGGEVALPALAAALNELVRRHESLRTTFAAEGEQVVQLIAPARPQPLPLVALAALPDGPRAAERRRLAAAAACRLFDLQRGPLLRAILLRLTGREHVLLLALHHIVSDAWSQGVLLDELTTLYAAFAAGLPSPLPELPIQVADFAAWQREWLRGEALETHLAFWRGQLAGAPALLELPLDRPRPAVQSFRGARRAAELPPSLAGALRAAGRRQGATLFMTLLAAFATVLARYAGREEIVIGTPIANRNRLETESLIGFFVNTLALRIDLAGDPSGGELLARVREVTLSAYAHQDLPFEKLVEELRPQRNLSHAPLFQVLMILQNNRPARLAPAAAAGLTLGGEELDHGTAKFDLNLALAEVGERLLAALEYCRDLFFATTAERLLRHFAALAGGLAADPVRRLSELSLLTAAERQQLIAEWNDTAAPYPRELCLHEPFAAQAARAPRAPAVLFGEECWSYGELECWANQLARLLGRVGVGPGKLAGIFLERRCEMVGAVLAVHKAGGAYVPLEIRWPPERLHWILASCGIACLVTEAAQLPLLGALPELPSLAHVVTVDPLDGAPAAVAAALWSPADFGALPASPPPRRGGPDELAYIIFTSGSTGRPKGVMVRHRPVLNLIHWVNQTFAVGPADRLLFVTALSFDLSVYDVFGMLAAGGSVRIARSEEVRDPEALVRILRSEPVTFWDSAPAALQQLVPCLLPAPPALPESPALPASPDNSAPRQLVPRARPDDEAPSLRLVFLSGDWIPVTLPDRLREAFPRARVISLGGATEATVWSNWFPVAALDPAWTSIPYGRPIPNARYHILDAHANPCPIGVPGDLFIAGECLSEGYFGAPELTAKAYRPDPLSGEAGTRLYATGDRARYGADGNIEFLGRVDSQIKLRGFRIELGEIESVLGAHGAVREAVVLVREDTPGDRRLVAYVIPQGEPPAPHELRRFAQRKLPDYMVPSAFVLRDSWPVSANGKLDRKALPPPEAPHARQEDALELPRTAVERAIAAVWREVIGLAEVGVRDNFFEVGGHSLLMARVQARLEAALGRTIPLVELFQHPTISALATHVSGGPAEELAVPGTRRAPVSAVAIAVVGLAGRFPGAGDAAQFWRNLRDGVESIRVFSDDELLVAGFPAELLGDPRLVKARGMLDGADLFDAAFFGYAPREAQIIDPQQRLFLECAWEALEDAGYGSTRRGVRVGVYGGATENTYVLHLLTDPEVLGAVGRHQISIANNPDFLCTRVSYKLNLTGPSTTVQSACSTSLVAVHMACAALLRGDCDLALAGGVSVQAREVSGYLYEEGGISSPDGHTRAFDAAARGVVGGSGAGVVVLRRLDEALADGDTVRGVVLGSAVNNDGNLKVGFTAPSVDGQAAVIREALAAAEVDPATISYVEAHGTGTELGDPVEIAGLARAFGAVGTRRCALGSVKTNVGHLDAAAGVAGLIKTVLALEHRLIPPSLHFTRPNPTIDFAATPFYVNSRLAEWPAGDLPRRAGVSSFGMGGTNAHLILEEAPPVAAGSLSRPMQLLLVSGRTPAALDQVSRRLAEHLERRPDLDLADVAHTLQVGRRAFSCRRLVVCGRRDEAAAALRGIPSPGSPQPASGTAPADGQAAPVVFLFPGQGTQYPGMAADLYAAEPDFRNALDECCELLAPHLGRDLRELLYPRRGAGPSRSAAARQLDQTELAQPALFAVEYSLARLFMAWGIRPQAMLGHSVGELVAACLAGVFSLPEALRLVAARGKLMQQLPPGAMLAVELAEEAVRPLLGDAAGALGALGALDMAAVNGPRSCVVSGAAAAVAALRSRLEQRGVSCRLLHISHAFHSAMMDPILAAFGEQVAAAERRPPQIAWLSNVTGGWISAEEAVAPAYWARHLRQTVRFADALAALRGHAEESEGAEEARSRRSARGPEPILLEVGPGRTLTTLARQQAGQGGRRVAIASLPNARDRGADLAAVLGALGRLWLAGAEVDWDGFHAHERRRRVPLPTYPFERQRCWLAGGGRPGAAAATPADIGGGSRMASSTAAVAVPAGAWEPAADTLADAVAAPGAAAPAGFIAPRDEVEQGIAEIWRDLLGVERVGAGDDFFALGGSSLMAVQFGSRLRRRFGVEGASLLLEASTLADLAAQVAARTRPAAAGDAAAASSAPPSCLVRLQAGGARRPLFMVHQVGGHVFTFRALARGLGREIPVYGLRSHGLEEGEKPLPTVEQMAELYLDLVRGVQPHGPYRIGGASMGGMVAWEMAHRLRSAGEAVELLALMDTPCGEQMPPRPRDDWEFVGGVLAGRVDLTRAELAPLALDEQLAYALDKARQAGAGDDLTIEAARRLVEVMRANVGALFGYVPRPYPGRLLFFRARERRPVDPPRPELPWIELAEEGVEVVLVPGNHETMHAPPQVDRMVDRLTSLL